MNTLHAPVFSIITITYNAEATLEVTLQSVIGQSYPHIEYIVVDGASSDGTLAIIERYRSHFKQVVSEPDGGLYDAMNKGMKLATGDYLCFLNAGDTFHTTDTLEKVVESLPAGDRLPDILYGDTEIVDANRRFLRMRHLSAPEVLTWKSFRKGMLVCHQAFYCRRSLAEPYDLNYRYSADFDWCIRMMKKAKGELLNTHFHLIDYLEEGVTTRHQRASLLERFRIMTRYYGWLTTIGVHIGFIFRQLRRRCLR
jgi:glycosyltransferase involved in cell wall biosynthesis